VWELYWAVGKMGGLEQNRNTVSTITKQTKPIKEIKWERASDCATTWP